MFDPRMKRYDNDIRSNDNAFALTTAVQKSNKSCVHLDRPDQAIDRTMTLFWLRSWEPRSSLAFSIDLVIILKFFFGIFRSYHIIALCQRAGPYATGTFREGTSNIRVEFNQ